MKNAKTVVKCIRNHKQTERMNAALTLIIVATTLIQSTLCMPTEQQPVPSIDSISKEELASLNADQLTAIILKNIVHDADEKATDFKVALKNLLADIDKLIVSTDEDNENSELYLHFRQKVENFLHTLQEDMAACGLYSLAVSVSNQIASYLLFRDQQLYDDLWQKYFSEESELFDFSVHMKNIASTSEKMEQIFANSEQLHTEVSTKVIAEVEKCRQVDILGMFFLVEDANM